jgi:hypothetical protein
VRTPAGVAASLLHAGILAGAARSVIRSKGNVQPWETSWRQVRSAALPVGCVLGII